MATDYFNSQPHEEADQCSYDATWLLDISTHSLTKRLTTIQTLMERRFTHFNSQPHEEADLIDDFGFCVRVISTHSLTKRLTGDILTCTVSRAFQLTASRRGWREEGYVLKISGNISTHSLTKRLTYGFWLFMASHSISTHSLTKRLTSNHFKYNHFFLISTHSLTKRLTADKKTYYYLKLISTHSLTKRLTVLPSVPVALAIFQLTASRRGWRSLCRIRNGRIYFNSQPHEEADYIVEQVENAWMYFNSQPHEEADNSGGASQSKINISTHSLTKRLTVFWMKISLKRIISTHSLTKRLTRGRSMSCKNVCISTHSLTKRLT